MPTCHYAYAPVADRHSIEFEPLLSKLTHLKLHHFRNLQPTELQFGDKLNLITGDNAAGKSALIEAIWLLATARSFRTHKPSDCIQYQQSAWTLFAQTNRPSYSTAQVHQIGLQRSANRWQIKLDGLPIKTQAELAQALPVQLLTPESHRLLEEGPKARRQFMDWGCFHQNTAFLNHWRHYQRTLKQRNQALKQKQPALQIQLWDPALLAQADQIDHIRQNYVTALTPYLQKFCQALMPELAEAPFIHYRSGWPQHTPLSELLSTHLTKDLKQGYTHYGCHRADLVFKIGQQTAQQALSRGQQKLFVCALLLAQAHLYESLHHTPVIMLIDDLPAELDLKHRTTLLQLLDQLHIQHFLTSTSLELIPLINPDSAQVWKIEKGRFFKKHSKK